MRETRQYGSEGGEARKPSLPLSDKITIEFFNSLLEHISNIFATVRFCQRFVFDSRSLLFFSQSKK